ncbi:hypothetical protein HPB49_003637 [Dermacentor silvarum]|uniref:Uncharacterized protein n=1 Tax=Dermacentor silvarum TaxID=543639 RepID=A0ACB8CPM8_DERSI|nr:hypothetical protein HPB49_003637 [Dermacentor silvarum]
MDYVNKALLMRLDMPRSAAYRLRQHAPNVDHFGVESEQHYINILWAGVSRSCIVHSRSVGQKWVNPFNPWIASILDSNVDLQVILDYYA